MAYIIFVSGFVAGISLGFALPFFKKKMFLKLKESASYEKFAIIFAPKNLNYFLFEVPLLCNADLHQGAAYCSHENPGNYEVGISCSNSFLSTIKEPIEVFVDCVWRIDNGVSIEIFKGWVSLTECWFNGNENGFSIARYKIPDEIKINQRVQINIKITSPLIESTYGQVSVYARNIDIY